MRSADTQVILAGGPDDEQTVAQILHELDSDKNRYFSQNREAFVSAYGITKSLADLAALMYLSDLLICVDSAPMHVAVALKKQMLALFGPTNPELLLPHSPRCRYLKDGHQAKQTKTTIEKGINIQPNTVYQSVSDLLQIVKVQ